MPLAPVSVLPTMIALYDPLRPPPIVQGHELELGTAAERSELLNLSDWRNGSPAAKIGAHWPLNANYGASWAMKAGWPKVFTGGKNSDDPTQLAFDFDFAEGAFLDAVSADFTSSSFWEGTQYPTGNFQQSVHQIREVEQKRAAVADIVNAAFMSAHARNRWDLLDVWYPLVWDNFKRYLEPYWRKTGAVYLPKEFHHPPSSWPGLWPQMAKVRAELEDAYQIGAVGAWWTSIAEKRIDKGLPSPPWWGWWAEYRPYWWIVDAGVHSDGSVKSPYVYDRPGNWNRQPNYDERVLYSLGELETQDLIVKALGQVALSFMGGAMLGAGFAQLWAASGAPAAPVITDALAAGVKAHLGGGDFNEVALESVLGSAGELVGGITGNETLELAADLAAGNIEPEEIAMDLLDSFTDGLGWIDDAVGDASDFLDDLSGIGESVSSLAGIFGGGGGFGGSSSSSASQPPGINPGDYGLYTPPIFDGEAAGTGTPIYGPPSGVGAQLQSSSSFLPLAALALILAVA